MAGVLQLPEVEQGSTLRFRLTWYSPGPIDPVTGLVQVDETGRKVKGPPVDLTGCKAQSHWRKRKGASESNPVLMELSGEEGSDVNDGLVIQPGGQLGVIEFHATDEKTMGLTARSVAFDLYVEFPSGERYRILEAEGIKVDPTVTDVLPVTP